MTERERRPPRETIDREIQRDQNRGWLGCRSVLVASVVVLMLVAAAAF